MYLTGLQQILTITPAPPTPSSNPPLPHTRICIFSTVHLAHDVRLFQAEARTLARAGFDVTVIALRDDTPSETDGITVVELPRPANRWSRLRLIPRVLRLALRQRADLYAFHDPELLPVAAALRLLRRRPVIYDVHEDVPASIRNRGYLARPLRPLVATLYRLIERLALPLVAGLTLADEAYGRYYRGRRAAVVRNYPLLTYADLYEPPVARRERLQLVYTGSVTHLRGLREMLQLVHHLRPRFPSLHLRIVGPMGPEGESELAARLIADLDLTDCVECTGNVSHADVHRHILDADVGLALLHPDPNYLRSLPTKMFEYMMMGRPVVVSEFPLWKRIVDEEGCGFAVPPLDLDTVAAAVTQLLEEEALRRRMGEAGRRAVLERYSWEREGERMVALYREVLGEAPESTRS